jgi:hypothetical protein
MRALLAEGTMALAVAPEANASSGGAAGSPAGPLWWVSECHGVWYSLAVMLPSLAFVGFLAWQARRSFRRLSYGRSHVVVVAYYALLWAVAVLNLLWCFLQVPIASLCCSSLKSGLLDHEAPYNFIKLLILAFGGGGGGGVGLKKKKNF